MNEALRRPVLFGEVLFDRFPDGRSVLGGAPFNVAWHLRGLGADPVFVSRIGTDEPAGDIVERMEAWGLDTAGVQRDAERPTGYVTVRIVDDDPSYEIDFGQAWDAVDAAAARGAARAGTGLVYHGSLGLRGDRSRDALDAILDQTDLPAFIDVNLRPPWWDLDAVVERVRRARWAKLNHEELAALTGDVSGEAAAAALAASCDLAAVIVTRGADGAAVYDADGVVAEAPAPPVPDLVDTVGAGDAFSAAFIDGLLAGRDLAETLHRALTLASRVCGMRGATAIDPSLYAELSPSAHRADDI